MLLRICAHTVALEPVFQGSPHDAPIGKFHVDLLTGPEPDAASTNHRPNILGASPRRAGLDLRHFTKTPIAQVIVPALILSG